MPNPNGRPADPLTQYRVAIRRHGKYSYACTRSLAQDQAGRRTVRQSKHWGTVDGDLKFHPNRAFLNLSEQEREKLIFPDGWDLSELEPAPVEGLGTSVEELAVSDSLFYGDIWLMEKVAEEAGVRQDLEAVFGEQDPMVDDILTLAMFCYLSRLPLSHVADWQALGKFPAGHLLHPSVITSVSQAITEEHKQAFLSLRALRCDQDELAAIDSTTCAAHGTCLAEIAWGRSKEGGVEPQTVEVVVYSLSRHEPIHYLSFGGNMTDKCTLPMILECLRRAGYDDVIAITDRGFECPRSIDWCIVHGQKLLTAASLNQKRILERIDAMGSFGIAPPGMELIEDLGVYGASFPLGKTVADKGGKPVASRNLMLHLFLNPVRRAEQGLELHAEIKAQEDVLRGLQSSGAAITSAHRKKCSYFRLEVDQKEHVLLGYERNERKIRQAERRFGFFAMITHMLDYTASRTLHSYRARDEQEKYFYRMKSDMLCDTQQCWSDKSRDGRRFIAFVGLILVSRVVHAWRSSKVLRARFACVFQMLEVMRRIRIIEHPGQTPVVTPFVGKAKTICDEFGFDIPEGCAPRYVSPEVESPGNSRKRGRPPKETAP